MSVYGSVLTSPLVPEAFRREDVARAAETIVSLLLEDNEKFNLTAITEEDEIFFKHIVDSLIAAQMLGDALRDKDSSIVAVMAAVNGEKITFQCVCGKDAVAKGVKAGDIIRSITAIAGGKGGGKPDSAMGGGNDVSKLEAALAAVETFVADKE